MKRPHYLALDERGLEYSRLALFIGELPVERRAAALAEATGTIALRTGLVALKCIPFGACVFTAYASMDRPKANAHIDSKLLLLYGDDVPLDFCRSYE